MTKVKVKVTQSTVLFFNPESENKELLESKVVDGKINKTEAKELLPEGAVVIEITTSQKQYEIEASIITAHGTELVEQQSLELE